MKIVDAKRLFVGLDYHQDFVQVCVLEESDKVVMNRQVENDWRKISALAPAGAVVQVALEACCGAADLADELAGWSVGLAHPGFVARMKQNPDKTDYSDARLLANLGRLLLLWAAWTTLPARAWSKPSSRCPLLAGLDLERSPERLVGRRVETLLGAGDCTAVTVS